MHLQSFMNHDDRFLPPRRGNLHFILCEQSGSFVICCGFFCVRGVFILAWKVEIKFFCFNMASVLTLETIKLRFHHLSKLPNFFCASRSVHSNSFCFAPFSQLRGHNTNEIKVMENFNGAHFKPIFIIRVEFQRMCEILSVVVIFAFISRMKSVARAERALNLMK